MRYHVRCPTYRTYPSSLSERCSAGGSAATLRVVPSDVRHPLCSGAKRVEELTLVVYAVRLETRRRRCNRDEEGVTALAAAGGQQPDAHQVERRHVEHAQLELPLVGLDGLLGHGQCLDRSAHEWT